MKAVASTKYGPPDVLELAEVERPTPKDNEVLLKVHAASVNPADWHLLRGDPYIARLQLGLRKPKHRVLGCDVAGRVEAVGENVTTLRPGDGVFGSPFMHGFGAFAECVSISEDLLAPKPANFSFEHAAAVPLAASTALQGLRDHGRIEPGHKVLIIGASGGVGTFAVQIARSFDAEVTGVCSTRNVEMVRSLGAKHVVDYTREDFARSGQNYDLIFQLAGTRSPSECRSALTPKGTLVQISGDSNDRWIGPVGRLIKALLLSPFVSERMISFTVKPNKADLDFLKQLIEAGKLTPVIDKSYPLAEVPEAIRYLENGHARGKVVITVPGERDRRTCDLAEREALRRGPTYGAPWSSGGSVEEYREGPPFSRKALRGGYGTTISERMERMVQETNRHDPRYDVVVVGGGSAGLSAALVLGRSRRRTLVLDSGEPRNAPSSGIHGFFSRDGIAPEELLQIGREQLEMYPSVEVRPARAAGAGGENGDFEVTLDGGALVRARKLVLATGVVDELPDKPGFEELWGRGVYHCPYCHGWEVRDRPLAVLNPGEGVAERAAFIRNWSRDLVLLTDGPANLNEEGRRVLRALDIPVREERISHLEGDPGGAPGGLRLIHFEDGSSLEREGLFYVPPQRQGSELARMLGCEIGPMGQAPSGVKNDPTTRETSVAGVYVAGDAGNAVQSALLAAASGANAAFFVNHSLVAEEVAATVGAAV